MKSTTFGRTGRVLFLAPLLLTGLLPTRGGARPGGAAFAGGASARAGAGGLIIDYSKALKGARVEQVQWANGLMTVAVSGGREHRFALSDWQLADVLDAVRRTNDGDGYIEVSLDRGVGGEQNFAATPELRVDDTVRPVGRLLQKADLDFAEVVQAVEPSDDAWLKSIAPAGQVLSLLGNDKGKYRRLARDLVTPPPTWPQIRLIVGGLEAVHPIALKADFQIYYPMPDGQSIDGTPHPSSPIEPWMIKEAARPYRPLERVLGDPAEARRLLGLRPLLQEAHNLAFAFATLDGFCQRQAAQCDAFAAQVQGAEVPQDFRKPEEKREPTPEDLMQTLRQLRGGMELQNRWAMVRLKESRDERDPDYKRWIFVDEALFSLLNLPRWKDEDLIGLLPRKDGRLLYGEGEVGLAARLLEAAVRIRMLPEGTDPAPAIRLFQQRVEAIDKSNLKDFTKTHWKGRAAIVARALVGKVTSTFGEEAAAPLAGTMASLYQYSLSALGEEVRQALTRPESRSAKKWLEVLGRVERLQLLDLNAPEVHALVAAIQYAVGYQLAAESRAKARDRLRYLHSYVAICRQQAAQNPDRAADWNQAATAIEQLANLLSARMAVPR